MNADSRTRALSFGALALLISVGTAPVAYADLLLSVQSVVAAPGDTNDLLNVYVTNLGAAPAEVAAFNFEIDTTLTDITFEQATTGTTLAPYIFAGNSLFGPVISTSAPGQSLDASDVAAVPNSSTVVDPGASFGLGEIWFNVAALAPAGILPVDFNTGPAFTSVSDPLGNLLPLSFADGQITIKAPSTVPEPSTVMLVFAGLAGLAGVGFARRKRRARPYLALTA